MLILERQKNWSTRRKPLQVQRRLTTGTFSREPPHETGLGFSVARVTACATPLIFYDQNKLKTTDMDYYTNNRNPFPRILHRLDNYMFLDRFSSI